jgi:uncharacterized protein (TIGR03435 family)
MKLAHFALIFTLAGPSLLAQSSPCADPTAAVFDVASVKPIQQSAGSFSVRSRPDSLTADGTLAHILEYAFNLHGFQITGGPSWLSDDTWDIVIKVDQPPANWDTLSNDARNAIQRQRMVSALAQRFALHCHIETRQLPVYNLVLAKGGPKPALAHTPADAPKKGSFSSHDDRSSVVMQSAGGSLDMLATNLVRVLGRTVINETGLSGIYDFTLTYAPDATNTSTDADATGPTVFTALEEQLGLKLEPAKGPVPVLVVDSVQKPSEN